jgi:hypothetical protein
MPQLYREMATAPLLNRQNDFVTFNSFSLLCHKDIGAMRGAFTLLDKTTLGTALILTIFKLS